MEMCNQKKNLNTVEVKLDYLAVILTRKDARVGKHILYTEYCGVQGNTMYELAH